MNTTAYRPTMKTVKAIVMKHYGWTEQVCREAFWIYNTSVNKVFVWLANGEQEVIDITREAAKAAR